MAGYSGTPLVKKLGIKPGHRLVLLDAPDGFPESLPDLPADVAPQTSFKGKEKADVILCFTRRADQFKKGLNRLISRLDSAGGLWICWPKKASKVPTDLTEDVIRNHALDAGLVDNKVCAIDDVWSGLRLVFRLIDRPKQSRK